MRFDQSIFEDYEVTQGGGEQKSFADRMEGEDGFITVPEMPKHCDLKVRVVKFEGGQVLHLKFIGEIKFATDLENHGIKMGLNQADAAISPITLVVDIRDAVISINLLEAFRLKNLDMGSDIIQSGKDIDRTIAIIHNSSTIMAIIGHAVQYAQFSSSMSERKRNMFPVFYSNMRSFVNALTGTA